jgi:hypothetical protein
VTPTAVAPSGVQPPSTGSAGLTDDGNETGQVIAWLGIAALVVLGTRYSVKSARRRR